MTNLTNFTNIIFNGMNDPNCSFYVGAFAGTYLTFKYIIIIALLYYFFKTIDQLVINPLLDYIKDKFYKRKKCQIKK